MTVVRPSATAAVVSAPAVQISGGDHLTVPARRSVQQGRATLPITLLHAAAEPQQREPRDRLRTVPAPSLASAAS